MSVYSPRILDRGLNAAVLHLADVYCPRGYDVSPTAPETLEGLKALDRMCVSSGHSEGTIFGDPEVNYAFRAWHDACHLLGDYPFTLEGETDACSMQCNQLVALYGAEKAGPWCKMLRAEVIGQACYIERWHEFPVNQVKFDLAYLINPDATLARPPTDFA